MPSRKTRKTASTATKMGELAIAAPQVVAHRLTRMALAGPVLSPRDRKEFTGMVREKEHAFFKSWVAMFGEAARVQQSMFTSWLSPGRLLSPWSLGTPAKQAAQLQAAALRIASKGLAPVHSKAVSNAKRLRKTKLK